MARRVTLETVETPSATIDMTPVLTQGEQTYVNKVKEFEARVSGKPSKKSRASQKTKTVKAKPKQAKQPMNRNNPSSQKTKTVKAKPKQAKQPINRTFHLSNVMKGRKGVAIHKGTTLWSLVRHLPWTKTPMLNLLTTRVKLLDGHLNKRTTLLSLLKNLPESKLPLLDIIGNKKV